MTRSKIPAVFKVLHTEEVELISYINRDDLDRTIFDGRSLITGWEPIPIKRITEDEGQQWISGDFPSTEVGDLALNRKARDAIGRYLEPYGELLPLLCDDGEFWTLNVTCIIDALNEKRSVIHRSTQDGSILLIRKYIFRPDPLVGAFIFRLPQYARNCIFVTTPFVELIKSSGLTGLTFKQIWAPD